ncbi:MAG: TIGR01777 family oxidoreductase [Syntrophales bacterium]|nr:TIGR01777 family oxidoreductase [Syntrophales bacterium]
MKIFMTGGTGFVGTTLTRRLTENGHEVTILKRPAEQPVDVPARASLLMGDPTARGPWQNEVANHDVIINLAGSSIFSRWTEESKKLLRESRLTTTRHLVEAMEGEKRRAMTLISTSAVGYYGFHGDEFLTENDPAGSDFLAQLAADWENEALQAEKLGVRVVICRFGIVLGRGGGALGQMIPMFKYWLGSPVGSGEQWFSWIHQDDLARIYLFLLSRPDITGPINCTAPKPVRNRELTEALGKALKVPVFLPPVPAFLMRLIMGEFGDVLLKGQRVVPDRLIANDFDFRYPQIQAALSEAAGK